GVVCGRGGGQIGGVEFGKMVAAEQAETTLPLVLQQLEQSNHAGLPAGGERKALHAADADQIGAGGDRLDDVGPAADRSVDDDLGAAVHGGHDLRQHVHGAAAVIELAAAVVGDVNPLDSMVERDGGILGGGDAPDRRRELESGLDALDPAPVE